MGHSSDNGAGELAGRVGRLVRAQRMQQRLTSAELADRSGLSRTIVSRIESGEGNPSIGTLWRLSRALHVSLGDLIDEPEVPRTRVIRAGQGTALSDPSGMVARLLHGDQRDRRTELYTLELPAGARREGPGHLPGVEELIVVTRGRADVGPDADSSGTSLAPTLETGDAMWFAADAPHHYATVGPGASQLLCWMLYPPAAG